MSVAYNFHRQKRRKFFCDNNVHPVLKQALKTRGGLVGLEIVFGNFSKHEFNDEFCGVLFAYPDINGNISINKKQIDRVKDTENQSEAITEITYLENPLGKENPSYTEYNTFRLNSNNVAKKIPDANGNMVNINLEELMDMSIDPTICLLPHQIVNLSKIGMEPKVI